ncbi:hypothetical protein M569_09767 [Genlisea aurea]|uniref:Uncharacterized protein n=1 Tax=Genlisea aurea TaxID=192259 RepID=S8DPL5_9LAMI|nr:hypothetical protein M569_09767 [Genlisea aurea]
MAATVAPLTTPASLIMKTRVCFSYAAYAKSLIAYLRSLDIPVDAGMSELEFAAVESAFDFVFPPDLRSILREGLPVGSGFPNWRSSSREQIEVLMNLPMSGIRRRILRNEFWAGFWGERPVDDEIAAELGDGFLRKSPKLVPIFRQFYIPATPCASGNPVFRVNRGAVRIWSFDIPSFFQRIELGMSENREFSAPAWAATADRRVEFWTDLAKKNDAAARVWWSGELNGFLQDACRKLREGGWKEEDVREMMIMDGCDDEDETNLLRDAPDNDLLRCHVSKLSTRLLRAGWSRKDVVDSLGFFLNYTENIK